MLTPQVLVGKVTHNQPFIENKYYLSSITFNACDSKSGRKDIFNILKR